MLECHHAATTFHVLALPGCELFAHLGDATVLEVRSLIINAILATDMAHHHEMVAALSHWAAAPHTERIPTAEVLATFTHLADLANVVLRWDLAEKWAARVGAEATNEFVEMKRIGLPLPVYAKLSAYSVEELAARQIVFSDGWVTPLYKAAARLFPGAVDRISVLRTNREACKTIHKEAVKHRLRARLRTIAAFRTFRSSPEPEAPKAKDDDESAGLHVAQDNTAEDSAALDNAAEDSAAKAAEYKTAQDKTAEDSAALDNTDEDSADEVAAGEQERLSLAERPPSAVPETETAAVLDTADGELANDFGSSFNARTAGERDIGASFDEIDPAPVASSPLSTFIHATVGDGTGTGAGVSAGAVASYKPEVQSSPTTVTAALFTDEGHL